MQHYLLSNTPCNCKVAGVLEWIFAAAASLRSFRSFCRSFTALMAAHLTPQSLRMSLQPSGEEVHRLLRSQPYSGVSAASWRGYAMKACAARAAPACRTLLRRSLKHGLWTPLFFRSLYRLYDFFLLNAPTFRSLQAVQPIFTTLTSAASLARFPFDQISSAANRCAPAASSRHAL
jgi:hypothetical protein